MAPDPASWRAGGKAGHGKTSWLIGAAVAVAVAAAVAAAVVLTSKSSPTPAATPTIRPTGTPSASASSGNAFPNFPGASSAVIGRVTDTGAGISWAKLGKPWSLKTFKPGSAEFDANQFVTTDTFTDPSGKPATWSANVLSGVLQPDAKAHYTGPGSLQAATVSYVDNVVPKMYFPGSSPQVYTSHAVTISGHPAWLRGLTISYNVPGVKATKDTAVVVLVDTGRASPAVFVMVVPNDVSNLLPDITTELQSLEVSG